MTKTLCNFIRTLGVATLLAAAALSLFTGAAHAAPKSAAQLACEAKGRVWSAKNKVCADKWCVDDRYGILVPPGYSYAEEDGDHWYCDGFTGRWDKPELKPALPGTGAPLTNGAAAPAANPTAGPRAPVRGAGGILSPR
jgi:hypothetical protein